MVSVNTVLLNVFRALSSCDRSFSVGDLAFPRTAVFDQLLDDTRGAKNERWVEHELRVPIDNQCPCEQCRQHSVPKQAVELRVNGAFVVVRLRPHVSVTLSGMLFSLQEAIGRDPHTVPGCANRSCRVQPYTHEAIDIQTYALLCRLPHTSMDEFRDYNRVRLGNEFFVPTELASDAPFHPLAAIPSR